MNRRPHPRARNELARGLAVLFLAIGTLGCGSEPRTVSLARLVPDADPLCGAPSDARTLRIAAIGEFAASDTTARSIEIGVGDPFSIDAFPPETQALEIEVLGAGGALRAVGRTEEFDSDALAGGDEISVFMAPPNNTCPTGPPTRARSGALIATSGDTVVVVGGLDADGTPITRPEIYLADSARFEEIPQDLYGDISDGLVGASLTPMPDGRIALIGGGQNAFQVYTPELGQFSEPPLLFPQARAFHAAVALDDDRVFLAGGCTMIEDGACVAGSENGTTAVLSITTGDLAIGPPLTFLRVGAKAFLESDGRVIVVGGSFAGNPVLSAERLDPQDRQESEILVGSGQVGVRLVSGAILTAFGPLGAPSGDGTAYAPGGTEGDPLATAGARAAPTLTSLESGSVLAFGGAGGTDEARDEAALYAAVSGRWTELPDVELQRRRRHATALLPDGSVLIVGGEADDGSHLGDALIFRPDLLGPLTGSVAINFADQSAEQLIARAQGKLTVIEATEDTPAFLRMDARATDSGIPGEWAVVGAPVLDASDIELTASSDAGLAILTGFEEPTTFRATIAAANQPVVVLDQQGGSVASVPNCSGDVMTTAELGARTRWRHQTETDRIRLFYGDRLVLDCDVETARRGRVGVGPLGATGSALALFQLTIGR